MTASYSLFLKPSVERDIRGFPRKDAQRIDARLLELKEDPRPLGCKKLSGKDQYRIRQGDYRILYTVDDELHIVRVFQIVHRRDAY